MKMVRTAVADHRLLPYLTDASAGFTVGLILGQTCSGKDYIVHLAKTPPEEEAKPDLKSLRGFNETLLSDHAKQVTRMLPGAMSVLGMFIVSTDDVLNPFDPKIKSTLSSIHKELEGNKYLYGNGSKEKIVLNYCTKTKKHSCKSYDVETFNVQPMEFKFVPNAVRWISVECELTINHLKYLNADEKELPLQKHIQEILDDLKDSLDSSVYLFNGEIKDISDTFEPPTKSRSPRTIKQDDDAPKPVQLTIYQSKDSSPSCSVLEKFVELRMIGRVVSKLWLEQKMTVGETIEAVKQDVMRSLAARFEMHWDSLTEGENSEEVNCVHEPPRRVLVRLPDSLVTMSNYLFPGEGPEDARESLEEVLDMRVEGKLKIQDVEGLADISQYCGGALTDETAEILPKITIDPNSFTYLGLAAAVLVLLLSMLLYFYKK